MQITVQNLVPGTLVSTAGQTLVVESITPISFNRYLVKYSGIPQPSMHSINTLLTVVS